MATVTISSTDFDAFASVAEADNYLLGDAALWDVWNEASDDEKGRYIVSATRYLLGLTWIAGDPPAYDAVPDALRDATSILAAMILEDPTLTTGANKASNVKSVGAGPTKVEFFGPTAGSPLPPRLKTMLSGLIQTGSGAGASTPYDAGTYEPDRLTDQDIYGIGGYSY